jgi:hypothetical protein
VDCQRYEARTDALYKADENGKQRLHLNEKLRIQCVDSSCACRHCDWNTAINILRLLTTELEGQE